MRNYAPWTPEEEALLREKVPTVTGVSELVKFFPGRSRNSINSKVKAQGLEIPQKHQFDWSPEELQKLRDLAKEMYFEDLWRCFPGKSRDRVRRKIKHMKLVTLRSTQRQPWTRKEDAQLRDLAGNLSGPKIAKEMGRSLVSIYRRAEELDISLNNGKTRSRPWTLAEMEQLAILVPTGTLRSVALNLGRTERSVSAKASTMGLEFKRTIHGEWGSDELALLMVHYKNRSVEDLAKELGRTYSAVTKKANSLGLTRPTGPKKKWTLEDRKIIFDHAGKMGTVELAELMGRSRQALSRYCLREGISLESGLYDFAYLTDLFEGDGARFDNTMFHAWIDRGLHTRDHNGKIVVWSRWLKDFWKEFPEAMDVYSLSPETLDELDLNLDDWPELPNFKIIACFGNASKAHHMVLNCTGLFDTNQRCAACGGKLPYWANGYSQEWIEPQKKVKSKRVKDKKTQAAITLIRKWLTL